MLSSDKLNNSNSGIVLRVDRLNNKISIFDQKLGKIKVNLKDKKKKNLFSGAYIYYFVNNYNVQYNMYSIENIEIVEKLSDWVREDILFLHHVLEICYYFSAINNTDEHIFELLKYLYKTDFVLKTAIAKKIYICNLFKKLGIFSPNTMEYNSNFINYILYNNNNLNIDFDIELDDNIKRDLDKWLLECIYSDSQYIKFKTLKFLK